MLISTFASRDTVQERLYAIWTDESGQDMAEYAILLALLAIVVILAINALAPAISDSFTESGQAIATGGCDGGGGGAGTGGGGEGGCGSGGGGGVGGGSGD